MIASPDVVQRGGVGLGHDPARTRRYGRRLARVRARPLG